MSDAPYGLFVNLHRYPSYQHHANQWSEDGWLFVPQTGRFYSYSLDRKDGGRHLGAGQTREDFERGASGDDPRRAWARTFVEYPGRGGGGGFTTATSPAGCTATGATR